MFDVVDLTTAIQEAERFIAKAKLARVKVFEGRIFGCKETGACRRSSMDLTRALADIRRSPGRE